MLEMFKVKNGNGAVLSVAVNINNSNRNPKSIKSEDISFHLYYEPTVAEEREFTREMMVWGSGTGKSVDTTDILRRELFFSQVKGKTTKEVDSRDDEVERGTTGKMLLSNSKSKDDVLVEKKKKSKRTLADTMAMMQSIREEEAAKEREKIAKFGIKRS